MCAGRSVTGLKRLVPNLFRRPMTEPKLDGAGQRCNGHSSQVQFALKLIFQDDPAA